MNARPMNRPARFVVVSSLLGLIASSTLAIAPAQADQAPLQLSRDQVHWANNLTAPLFNSDELWVPGDQQTVTVWARNHTTDPAILLIGLVDRSGDSLDPTKDSDFTLTGSVDGHPIDATIFGSKKSTDKASSVLHDASIGPGGTVPIRLTFSLPSSSTNQSQVKAAAIAVRVDLTQDGSALTGQQPTSGNGSDASTQQSVSGVGNGNGTASSAQLPAVLNRALASTGLPAGLIRTLAFGLLGFAAGLLILRNRRNRRYGGPTSPKESHV